MSKILVRPIEDADLAYVHSTARHRAIVQCGGRYAHRETVRTLTDAVLRNSLVRIGQLDDDPSILAWIAWGQTGEIEFLYLREALFQSHLLRSNRAMREQHANGKCQPGCLVCAGANATGTEGIFLMPQLSIRLVRAIVGDADVILRRPLDRLVMQALVLAGYEPSVIPRGI